LYFLDGTRVNESGREPFGFDELTKPVGAEGIVFVVVGPVAGSADVGHGKGQDSTEVRFHTQAPVIIFLDEKKDRRYNNRDNRGVQTKDKRRVGVFIDTNTAVWYSVEKVF
jgi:hypothetical protein